MSSTSHNAQDESRRLQVIVFQRKLTADVGMVKPYLQCHMKAHSASHLRLQNKVILWMFHREDGEVPSSNVPRWRVTKRQVLLCAPLKERRRERVRVGVCVTATAATVQ